MYSTGGGVSVSTPLNSDILNLGGAMIMILIDIVLYGFLAAWLDNIIPTGMYI